MENIEQKILLGFDFGMKRIGVAVGQTITQSARPLVTLNANQGIPQWEMIAKLIKTWNPDALVVGIPLNMDGTEQPLTQTAQKFSDALKERFKLPVYGMDERLSTKDARERLFNEGGYKALEGAEVDSVAAQLILENWLMEHHSDKK